MFYKDDIKLDQYGFSVIKDGDFVLTEDDKEFVLRMLGKEPGSWEYHPTLGVGLNEFVGETITESLKNKMITKIRTFFAKVGMVADVNVLNSDLGILRCVILISYPGTDKTITISFNFDVQAGGIKVLSWEDAPIELNSSLSLPTNKYLRRK